MRTSLFLLVFAFLLGFTGCASKRTMLLQPKYVGVHLEQRSLVIMPLGGGTIVQNPQDVWNHFGQGDSAAILVDHLVTTLVDTMTHASTFASVKRAAEMDTFALAVRELSGLGSEPFMMQLPSDGDVLQVEGEQPDFLLFLETLHSQAFMEKGMDQLPSSYFEIGGKYAFWDNREGRLVAAGYFAAKRLRELNLFTRRTNLDVMWSDLFYRTAQQLVKDSPFEKPRIQVTDVHGPRR